MKQLVDTYKVDPNQGAVAILVCIQKPGYKIIKIDRKNTICKVYYEVINKE